MFFFVFDLRSPVPVVVPPPKTYKNAYVSQTTQINGTAATATVLSNPDDAWGYMSVALQAAQTSIAVYIYQITEDPFSDLLINAYNNGVDVKVRALFCICFQCVAVFFDSTRSI